MEKKKISDYCLKRYFESSLNFRERIREAQTEDMLDNFSISSDREDIERYMRGKRE